MEYIDNVKKDNFYIKCFVKGVEVPIEDLNYLKGLVGVVDRIDDVDYSVELTCNTNIDFYDFFGFAEQIQKLSNECGSIKIFTSGKNMKTFMKIFPKNMKNVDVFVDDYDTRSYLASFEPSNINFNCHLSEKYLLNISDAEFNEMCNNNNLIFDRYDIKRKRTVIKQVWENIVCDINNLNLFDEKERVMLALDYIKSHVTCLNSSREIFKNIDGKKVRYVINPGPSDPIDALMKRCGNSEGLTKLACLLLDNYLVKVDCQNVHGSHISASINLPWIVTKIDEKKYGHCLTMEKRFKNLKNYGYVNGIICLEEEQANRKDFSMPVCDYSQLSELEYDFYTSHLKDKIFMIHSGDQAVSCKYDYFQKIYKKNTSQS